MISCVASAACPRGHSGLGSGGGNSFFRGREAIGRTSGIYPLSQSQNAYGIDTLDVPVESAHGLALVLYTIEPPDQDIPASHTTGTYLLD
jgi:hypothetical protein